MCDKHSCKINLNGLQLSNGDHFQQLSTDQQYQIIGQKAQHVLYVLKIWHDKCSKIQYGIHRYIQLFTYLTNMNHYNVII